MELVLSKFVERVKDLTEEELVKGTKLAQIAEKTEQNLSDLYHWKSDNNRYFPSLTQAIKLADYFSCSLNYLFGLEEENSLHEPNRELPTFSCRLKTVFDEKKIPITRVAKSAGFANTGMIYSWLNGKTLPRVDSLFALAKVLGCTPDYLLGREN